MWTVSSLFLNSRGVHFGRCGRLRNRASMPSGFLIDSRVLITVFEVPGRKGIDDIDAYATAYQAVGGTGHEPRADRARAACVPDDGGEVRLEGGFLPSSGRQGWPDAGRFGVRRDRRGMVDRRSQAPAQAAAYRHAGVAAIARRARVRGFVSVGAALGQAVAGAASRGVGGVCAARVGAGDRAGGFRPGARVDRGRGACGSFPGGLVPVFEHAVCRGVAG